MNPFIKDRIMRTIGHNKVLSNTIYIISTNIEYTNEFVKMLNISGLYKVIIKIV
jgi:hypothetical protein